MRGTVVARFGAAAEGRFVFGLGFAIGNRGGPGTGIQLTAVLRQLRPQSGMVVLVLLVELFVVRQCRELVVRLAQSLHLQQQVRRRQRHQTFGINVLLVVLRR